MSGTKFAVQRMDGRTNAQVLLDHVKDGAAGHVYTYNELRQALSNDTAKVYSVQDVQQIVRMAGTRMSNEQARVLTNVPTVGYKLAQAAEHTMIAGKHARKSSVQLRRGVQILSNVRYEEMDENQRRAHEGHLLITTAMYQSQKSLAKRQRKVEDLIESLTKRVDELTTQG